MSQEILPLPAGMPGGQPLAPGTEVPATTAPSVEQPEQPGGVTVKLPAELAPLEPIFSDLIEQYRDGQSGIIEVTLPAQPRDGDYPGEPGSDQAVIWDLVTALEHQAREEVIDEEARGCMLDALFMIKYRCLTPTQRRGLDQPQPLTEGRIPR